MVAHNVVASADVNVIKIGQKVWLTISHLSSSLLVLPPRCFIYIVHGSQATVGIPKTYNL